MASTLINVPPRVRRGEVFEIKTMISHVMETGYRHTERGETIPRDILRRFVCTYDGEEIFRAEIHPGIAANPFFSFTTLATDSGSLTFTWTGDNGFSSSETVKIVVE